jgi:dTDP-4-dehydrorhamnose 3,5-epimerase-like enzyme
MNNELKTRNNNNKQIPISKVVTYIPDLHYDPQHNKVSVVLINAISISYNWKSKEFKLSCSA